MDTSKFYVTTPIYYVNDKPHIGHAYTTILADVLARYHRLLERPTYFLTGTDEHGQKVQQAADKKSITPQEQCDSTVVRFQELWKKLEITHDDFIRTTEERHKNVVQGILQDLYERDEIYSDEYEGWYCVPCERFFTEKDLVEGCCPECKREVEKILERNYFFKMSNYQDWLVTYIEENPDFIQPAHRRQETLGFLRQPLGDLCISRPKSRLSWGIELPFDNEYVTYVWFDALVNYISGIGFRADETEFQKWWPASYHLIGKDILTTHTVYWPTMLKAIGIPMPEAIFAHGWWLVGRDKMSKSLGNVVNPMDMSEQYGVDAFRYFLMAEMSLGLDASFTEEGFVLRYNADLANDLGNMTSRVIKMIERNASGMIPENVEATDAEKDLIEKSLTAAEKMAEAVDTMHLDRGLLDVMNAVREGNRYFEQNAPWKLAKEGKTEELNRVLYSAAECLRIVSGLLYPVMPGKMSDLRKALGLNEAEIAPHQTKISNWGGLPSGRKIGKLASLFPRIDRKKEDQPAPQKQTKKKQKTSKESNIALIGIEDFTKLELKTVSILEAETVPDADRLLKLQVQLGQEKRQVVAGIAQHYKPEELIGKTVILVANLKPAKIRGVESHGMLLAAKSGKQLKLVTVDGSIGTNASVG